MRSSSPCPTRCARASGVRLQSIFGPALIILLGSIMAIVFTGCPMSVDPPTPSENANLSSLSLNQTTISPVFDPSITGYTALVGYEVSSITLTAECEDSSAEIVSGLGEAGLEVGQNTLTVIVEAEAGNTKTYSLEITRVASLLSANANLSMLSIQETDISPVFNAASVDYTAAVPFETTSVTILAECADQTALIESGPGAVSVEVGDNALEVVVRAEAGNTKTYTVVVSRAQGPLSGNADLSALSIQETELTPAFSPGTVDYTATVPVNVSGVTILAECADQGAHIVSGAGSANVAVGGNTLNVVVEAQNGDRKTYAIVVTREPVVELSRTFRAQRITDSSWYDVPATLLGAGDHVEVYVEDVQSISGVTAQAIADEFEANIYDMVRTSFGSESDVDGNGRVILLLLDILDGFSGSGGYVAGYFDPTHLFSTETFSNSNESDMLFMDVYPATPASDSFYGTAAHEMQHLVNFTNTYLVDGTQQDIWINEGLSSGAEYLYAGEHVASRINYYNADPMETIRYGNNFFVWNGYWEQVYGDVLADYSTVYLFFQWLRIHASNDSGVYKEILDSSYRDYRAVVSAASSRISSTLNSWETVLRSWLQANVLNASTGLRGYSGEIATSLWGFTNTGGLEWVMSSGESLVIQTVGGAYTYTGGSGTSIRYNGINTVTQMVDTVGSQYDGDAVLVFNSNSLYSASDQTAVLPSVIPAPAAQLLTSRSVATAPLPEIYPVDLTFQPGGGFAPESHILRRQPSLGSNMIGSDRTTR